MGHFVIITGNKMLQNEFLYGDKYIYPRINIKYYLVLDTKQRIDINLYSRGTFWPQIDINT